MKAKWILASQSPRRKELLTQMGVNFEIDPAQGEELMTKTNPEELVQELSEQKALEVARKVAQQKSLEVAGKAAKENPMKIDKKSLRIIIGADTVVAYENQILGKPKDEADAARMLTMLSGHTHQVYTGVTIVKQEGEKETVQTFAEVTDVTFYPMSEEEITSYIRSGEPMDKAGAYGIQGAAAVFIEKISGDYNNVVGLPIARLYQQCKKMSIL